MVTNIAVSCRVHRRFVEPKIHSIFYFLCHYLMLALGSVKYTSRRTKCTISHHSAMVDKVVEEWVTGIRDA